VPIQPFKPNYPFTDEKLAQLKQIVPEAFEDGRLNFDTLREVLEPNLEPEGTISDDSERFGLLWPGKKEARRLAAIPSKGTLAPVYGQGLKADGTPDDDGINDSRNVFIEGENLEVLKIMQKAYAGRVKMIYIDPPYNTGSDFVYDDNFTEPLEHYLRRTGQIDDEGQKLTTNTKADGRFHSKWLSMMYPRLRLARNLLREDGVIFVSIDDNEVDNLTLIGKEIFGEYNYLGTAARVSKKANNQGDYWSPNFDYVLTFAKNRDSCEPFFGGVNYDAYKHVDTDGERAGEKYQLVRLYMTSLDPMRGCTNQRYYIEGPNGINLIPPGENFPEIVSDGEMIVPQNKNDKVWRWSYDTYMKNKDRIVVIEGRSSNIVEGKGNKTKFNVFTKTYLSDVIKNSSAKPNSLIEDHINQKSSHELKELNIDFDFAKGLLKNKLSICSIG
jgi:adenine-specific DNA-methyltransferase